MSQSSGVHVGEADRPPDPSAAVAAVRQARQRLVASQGVVRMVLGLVFFVAFAIVRAVTDYKTEVHMQAVMLLVVAFIAMEILLPPIVTRVRRAKGLLTVGQAEADTVRFFGHLGWLMVLALAGVGACVLVVAAIAAIESLRVPPQRIDSLDTAVALACTALLVTLYVVRWRRVGLWEDLLMAVSLGVVGLLFAFLRARMRLEVMAMLAAIGAFASGLGLHFRWREFTRSLPGGPPPPTAEGRR